MEAAITDGDGDAELVTDAAQIRLQDGKMGLNTFVSGHCPVN